MITKIRNFRCATKNGCEVTSRTAVCAIATDVSTTASNAIVVINFRMMGLPSGPPCTIDHGERKLVHKVRQASHFAQMLKRTGGASRPLLRTSFSISRLRERNCLSFTLNGLDVTIGAASNYRMGQTYRSGRCEHCGGLMVLVVPVDGSGPGALRCLECDQIDPLQLQWTTAWLAGELRPPK
jgi:hypothetical protein